MILISSRPSSSHVLMPCLSSLRLLVTSSFVRILPNKLPPAIKDEELLRPGVPSRSAPQPNFTSHHILLPHTISHRDSNQIPISNPALALSAQRRIISFLSPSPFPSIKSNLTLPSPPSLHLPQHTHYRLKIPPPHHHSIEENRR